ncbi:hypothetical protein L227DRAFT_41067 [Lentinus tigrinus ALCF2SS1-6]|uniref:Uncharacterized protein n=1 Tax=Lentinus tigrinus ALCF2SS1-6 TaxID=1328759 RepID=A0A5C2RPX2_9APHY|nr:hypothetical protein L227DRAFT_41067 [Lentinus tigrinus ALCF2SS1-6]
MVVIELRGFPRFPFPFPFPHTPQRLPLYPRRRVSAHLTCPTYPTLSFFTPLASRNRGRTRLRLHLRLRMRGFIGTNICEPKANPTLLPLGLSYPPFIVLDGNRHA